MIVYKYTCIRVYTHPIPHPNRLTAHVPDCSEGECEGEVIIHSYALHLLFFLYSQSKLRPQYLPLLSYTYTQAGQRLGVSGAGSGGRIHVYTNTCIHSLGLCGSGKFTAVNNAGWLARSVGPLWGRCCGCGCRWDAPYLYRIHAWDGGSAWWDGAGIGHVRPSRHRYGPHTRCQWYASGPVDIAP